MRSAAGGLSIFCCLIAIINAAIDRSQADINANVGDGPVLTLTDATFDVAINEGLWLVKFVAPWCGHCKTLSPEFAATATRATDSKLNVHFGTVDATINHGLRSRFGIYAFPTIKLFSDGMFVRDYISARNAPTMLQFVTRIASFSVPEAPWDSDLADTIAGRIDDALSYPINPVPVSGFLLQCRKACDETRNLFEKVALGFMDHSLFIASNAPDDAIASSVLALTHDGISGIHLIEAGTPASQMDRLRRFVLEHQWPTMTALDLQRFNSLRTLSTSMSDVVGLVAFAADLKDDRLDRQIQKIKDVASDSRFTKTFKFGLMDGAGQFRRIFSELGIVEYPRVVVFGARHRKKIWLSPNLNVTRLEDGLAGILDGSLQPISAIDEKRRIFALGRTMFDGLYVYSTQSFTNLLIVLGLTLTGVTTFFCLCYFFILNVREKPEDVETRHYERLSSTPSTSEGDTVATSPRSVASETAPVDEARTESKKDR